MHKKCSLSCIEYYLKAGEFILENKKYLHLFFM